MGLSAFPWEENKEPYWINEENGVMWYADDDLTNYCNEENVNGHGPLNATCFIVAEMVEGEIKPITRILIDRKTNKILYDNISIETMAFKIDILRLAKSY